MNAPERELFERIANFAFDEGGEKLTFAARLARENGWSKAFAERAIAEYRRFVWLALAAGHPVTPSDAVDQVWHLHLTYTRSYWDRFCGEVLRQPLHHGPTKGGAAEDRHYLGLYERTLASYQQAFGAAPPSDVWPESSIRFGEDTRQARVNTARYWIIRKPRWPSRSLFTLAALPLMGIIPLWAEVGMGLTIAVVLIGLLVLFGLVAQLLGGAKNRNRDNDSGCSSIDSSGGGCSTGWSFFGHHDSDGHHGGHHDSRDSGGSGDSGCSSSGCSSGCGSGCSGG